MDNENSNVYIIPHNYEEAGGVFGGVFKFRNTIEAIIIGLILFKGGSLLFSYFDVTIRIILFVVILLPVVMVTLVGMHNESITEYIQSIYRFRQRKRVMSYRLPAYTEETDETHNKKSFKGKNIKFRK
jgi:hypothetical protein